MSHGWFPLSLVVLLAVYWSTTAVRAGSIFCDDSDLCLSKRFLRFGRGSDDPFIRRQFYRLARGFQSYQDKRFLRFGRSKQGSLAPDVDDVYSRALLQLDDQPSYSRKRRSLDADAAEASQSEDTNVIAKRSADQSQRYHEQLAAPADDDGGHDDVANAITKRAVSDDVIGGGGDVMEKRFMRFGRRFGGLGGGDGADRDPIDKRFMRFGKRLVVPGKRFMRFGRNNLNLNNNHHFGSGGDFLLPQMMTSEKRFMRFGKRKMDDNGDDDGAVKSGLSATAADLDARNNAAIFDINDVLALANQLKGHSAQKSDNNLYGMEKRFMRFGKRQDKPVDV